MSSLHTQRPPCKVATCIYEAEIREWCDAHYSRVAIHGDAQDDKPLRPHKHRASRIHPARAYLLDDPVQE